MRTLVIATNNSGKAREFRRMVKRHGLEFEVVSLRDLGVFGEAPFEGEEYVENAVAKARWAASVTGHVALADDSGLEVDALDGAPGPLSARYAGPGSSDEENVQRLLDELQGISLEGRSARFRCVLALALPTGEFCVREATCEGRILLEPVGEGGFGYDPVFFYEPLGKTFAEMCEEEKNCVSHRARAVEASIEDIKDLIERACQD